MFDAILKSKFYTKCKSGIKLTKTRIEMIRNKRNAMLKYLKNDIGDLLKAGLDVNAYGRAEGFIVELNLSSSYDLVEQFCCCVSSNLSLMSKQRECPEECTEAVGSLMFAAARFADLPELRDLRSTFADRYGNSLEAFASHELIKKLTSMPPTKDMKLRLLHDIATEIGKEWNPKTLEQKLYIPPPVSQQDNAKDTNGIKYNIRGSRNESIRKIDDYDAGHRHASTRDNASPRNKPQNIKEGEKNPLGRLFYGPLKNLDSVKIASSKGETNDNSPAHYRSIPPPYSKPKATEPPNNDNHDEANTKPISVRRRPKPVYEDAKRGLKMLDEDDVVVEEEDEVEKMMERMMDRLLLHYSTKEVPKDAPRNKNNKEGPPALAPTRARAPAPAPTPTRAFSLPPQPGTPAKAATKGPARAASFQPDASNHVHPKLPDYDDFVARLAALRAK